jgi:hypothetical protein
MANEAQRSRDGVVVLTEDDRLYFIPIAAMAQFEYTDADKQDLINALIQTGRLRNLKAARQIDQTALSLDVSMFGGTYP